MQLKDFIDYRVEVIQPADTLKDAAEKMRYFDVGCMPVCEGDRLIGVVTDRDIIIRAIADGKDPTKTEVRDVMTPDVLYCSESQGVEEAATLMRDHQVRRIFVVNDAEELVGVVALGDLATMMGDQRVAGATLQQISQPSESRNIDGEGQGQEDDEDEDDSALIGERHG